MEHKFVMVQKGNKTMWKDMGPVMTDPFDDSRANKTLERNLDKMPWYHNRTVPDNLFGETIERDKEKSKILRKKLRQMRKTTRQASTVGLLSSSMARTGGRPSNLASGSLGSK